MADKAQEYPDIQLRIDRDDKGNILQLDYQVNNAGADNQRIIEFIEILALLQNNPDESNRVWKEYENDNKKKILKEK